MQIYIIVKLRLTPNPYILSFIQIIFRNKLRIFFITILHQDHPIHHFLLQPQLSLIFLPNPFHFRHRSIQDPLVFLGWDSDEKIFSTHTFYGIFTRFGGNYLGLAETLTALALDKADF